MAHVNHPNAAKLIGYGVEGGMHLVLELSPNGSLASLLYGSKEKLTWVLGFKIALGTAEGLRYLHEGCKRRIIHRDIKAANILLTKDFDPQICDFGLAKWLPEQWTHHTVSKFEGTFGYLAPEYLMHGIIDEKTDVFAFGVLLLELVTGRRALDYSQQSLVLWPLLKKNDIRELIDPALGEYYSLRQVNLVLLAASMCIHRSSIRRPQMNQHVDIDKFTITPHDMVERVRLQQKHSMKRHTRKQVACDKMKWVDVVFTYIKKGTEQVWDEFGGGSSAIVEDMYIGESQGEGDKRKSDVISDRQRSEMLLGGGEGGR
ncbi:hypothetical protein V6N11_059751 [Hibiscus sabdariffa]|uniref:Protein kinase domain-containing protein n=1 Tax=Hibiscus sabdariffa TaxID=183260 RepID=A0ABR2NY78_9ROSI